jgi:hypothetical protein
MSDGMKKIRWYYVLISLGIFVLFMIFVLPNESQKSSALGIESSPDTSWFYTSDELYDIANQYGEAGRRFYIEQRFTFDLIWPLVYGLFLTLSVAFFGQSSTKAWIKKLYLLPLIAVGLDYIENIFTATVMYRYPKETFLMADIAGYITSLKWITLMISFMLLMWIVTIYVVTRMKKEKKHD